MPFISITSYIHFFNRWVYRKNRKTEVTDNLKLHEKKDCMERQPGTALLRLRCNAIHFEADANVSLLQVQPFTCFKLSSECSTLCYFSVTVLPTYHTCRFKSINIITVIDNYQSISDQKWEHRLQNVTAWARFIEKTLASEAVPRHLFEMEISLPDVRSSQINTYYKI